MVEWILIILVCSLGIPDSDIEENMKNPHIQICELMDYMKLF